MNELEANIVLSLVNQPSLVQTNEVDPLWFRTTKLSRLVKFLNDMHGDFKGFAQLRSAFTKAYPRLLNDTDWAALANSQSYNFEFKGYLKTLRQRYLQAQLSHAATNYALTQKLDTFETLKERVKALDEPEEAPQESLKETGDRLIHDLTHPVKPGIRTFAMLDDFTHSGLRGGNLLTIGARPSVGKSALAVNIVYRALMNTPEMTIDLFSLEMPKMEVYKRLMSIETGINHKLMYNPSKQLTEIQKNQIRNEVAELNQSGLEIYDNALSIESIAREIRLRAASARKGHYLAIVDYLQLVTANKFMNDRRQQVELVTRQIKLLTNELDIPIILLSQLSRGIESRQDKTPVLSDLRETGSIEQDSNMVAFLYREEASGASQDVETLVFDVQKNREGQLGKSRLKFNKPIQYMSEAYLS